MMDAAPQAGRYELERLHRWLSYELATGLLFLAMFVKPQLLAIGLGVAALVLTPVLLRALYAARRLGWIAGFVVLVVAPLGLPFLPVQHLYARYALAVVPFLTFYLYCWALRHAIGLWLEELRWQTTR